MSPPISGWLKGLRQAVLRKPAAGQKQKLTTIIIILRYRAGRA